MTLLTFQSRGGWKLGGGGSGRARSVAQRATSGRFGDLLAQSIDKVLLSLSPGCIWVCLFLTLAYELWSHAVNKHRAQRQGAELSAVCVVRVSPKPRVPSPPCLTGTRQNRFLGIQGPGDDSIHSLRPMGSSPVSWISRNCFYRAEYL